MVFFENNSRSKNIQEQFKEFKNEWPPCLLCKIQIYMPKMYPPPTKLLTFGIYRALLPFDTKKLFLFHY